MKWEKSLGGGNYRSSSFWHANNFPTPSIRKLSSANDSSRKKKESTMFIFTSIIFWLLVIYRFVVVFNLLVWNRVLIIFKSFDLRKKVADLWRGAVMDERIKKWHRSVCKSTPYVPHIQSTHAWHNMVLTVCTLKIVNVT